MLLPPSDRGHCFEDRNHGRREKATTAGEVLPGSGARAAGPSQCLPGPHTKHSAAQPTHGQPGSRAAPLQPSPGCSAMQGGHRGKALGLVWLLGQGGAQIPRPGWGALPLSLIPWGRGLVRLTNPQHLVLIAVPSSVSYHPPVSWGTPPAQPHPDQVSAAQLRASPRHKQISSRSFLLCTGFEPTLFPFTQRTESNFTLLCEHKKREYEGVGAVYPFITHTQKKNLHVASPRKQPPAAPCLPRSVRGSKNAMRGAGSSECRSPLLREEQQQRRVAGGTELEELQRPPRPPQPCLQRRNPPGEAKFLHQPQEKERGEGNNPETIAQTGQERC